MAKPKQKSLAKQLAEMVSTLEDLRDRIIELRYSTTYLEDGVKLYFAVDFSEVFSYLHLTREAEANVKILGVSLDPTNFKQNVLQYRLGLTYLFDSFNHPLYILPAHTQEMWSSFDKKVSTDQADSLLEGIRTLGREPKQLLESLENREQSKDISEELLDFVKSPNFAPLCVDVSEFVSWFRSAHALKGLLNKDIISPRIDELLARHNIHIAELKDPAANEIDNVVSMFPEKTRNLKPFATRIDARALLFLRSINRLLSPKKARLILVTRDANLLDIAKTISSKLEFDWTEAQCCVRGIETMFLDLILTSTPSLGATTHWILESEMLLARLHGSVSDRLEQIRRDGSGSHTSRLVDLGKQSLREAAHLWDQHINVKLSLASDSTTPLGRAFLELSTTPLPVSLMQLSREYQILKNLLEYFSTDIYKMAAIEDVQAVWDGIEIDVWRNYLVNFSIESLGEILGQTFTTSSEDGPTNLHSKRPFKMPSIRLVSKTYQDKLHALKTETGEKRERVLAIIEEVVTGKNEPEDLLVMAYIAGLLDDWPQALKLTAICRKMIARLTPSSLEGKIIPSEVDFFLSAIRLRLGRATADPGKALNFYLSAYQDIGRARAAVPDDHRYMMNEAAIVLQHAEQKLGEWPSTTKALSRAEAILQLKVALSLASTNNDIEFQIKILNNLIFADVVAEVIAEEPAFELTEAYLEQLDHALETATPDQKLLWSGFVVHVDETRVMSKATRARAHKDLNTLRECLVELERLNSDPDLIQHERASFASHIELVNSWIKEVEGPPLEPG